MAAPIGQSASVTITHDAAGNLAGIQAAAAAVPTFVVPPASIRIEAGEMTGFSVRVASTLPVSYQWKRNGIDIPGATADTLLFPKATVADEGAYSVVATNSLGSVTSEAASLSIDIREVFAWGLNTSGQTNVPVDLENVIALDGGSDHSIALLANGSVRAWGRNVEGQTTVPAGLAGVVAVAAGGFHNLALKADGTVVAWGYNNWGQINVPSGLNNVVAVAAGYWFSMALKSDGTLLGWGHNTWGQTTIPANVQGKVLAVRTGDAHTLALLHDGTVAVWGSNAFNQSTFPAGFVNTGIVGITARQNHQLVRYADGSLAGWGDNTSKPLTPPATLAAPVSVEIGYLHSLALQSDGTVVGWGSATDGQSAIPPALPPVLSVAAGGWHSLALGTADSAVATPVIAHPPTVLVGFGGSTPIRLPAKNSPSAYTATGLPPGLTLDAATGIVSGTVFGVGSFPAVISATNAFGTTQKTVTFVSLNPAGLTVTQVWRRKHFGTTENSGSAADLADPDGDLLPNLVELAAATDPTVADGPPGRLVRNGGVLEFTWTRFKAAVAEGLTFTVEWSDTLAAPDWTSSGVTSAVVSEDNSVRTVRATLPAGPGGQRFVRLRIARP